jgi:uncharacterized protein (DUF427 family)
MGVLVRAIWNGMVLAESADTIRLEGNHYFPPESLNVAYFADRATTSVCPWKGMGSYDDVVAGGRRHHDAAWYSPDPSQAAAGIAGRVACAAGCGRWSRVCGVGGLGK